MGETQASPAESLRVILSNSQPLVGSHHSFLCVTDPNDSLGPCNIFQASQSNAKNKMSNPVFLCIPDNKEKSLLAKIPSWRNPGWQAGWQAC